MPSLGDIEAARAAFETARNHLHTVTLQAVQDGIPEAKAARASGISRQTLRIWQGKVPDRNPKTVN